MRKFAFVILIALLAGSPLFAQRLSDEISADTYNDRDYGKMFTVDPAMKRFGVVLTNHSNRDVTVAHIHWKWIDANGKPGECERKFWKHRYFYEDHGAGEPVVLIHGYPTLRDAVEHHDNFFRLGLSEQQKSNLVEYLLSL